MSARYEYVDTSHPFFSVSVEPEPEPDDFMLAPGDEPGEVDDVLVISYDEAIVVTGDLVKFALMVNRAVNPEHDLLVQRVHDALVRNGHRLLADEYADANGAGR